jgi:hypothetical protein
VLPFRRACQLLEDFATPDFAPVLTSFLDAESPDVRVEAAATLGSIGTLETVPGLRKALLDGLSVQSAARTGLQRANWAKRLDPKVPAELFDELRGCLSGIGVRNAAELMLVGDRERAVKVLVAPELLSADHDVLFDLLYVLTSKDVEVPRATLIPLISKLEEGDPDRFGYPLASAMVLLGRHRDPQDRERLEHFASRSDWNSPNGMVGRLALPAWHGLEDFEKRIELLEAKKGKESLSPAQRHYRPVVSFDRDVTDGGFESFFESNGDEGREVLAGLAFFGLQEHAALLREALAKFGDTPPSADRTRRFEQLIELGKAKRGPFRRLDARYRALDPRAEKALLQYVVEHQDAFR